MSVSVELIMAEFCGERANAGDNKALPPGRTEPSLSSFQRHFPGMKATLYTDQDWESTKDCRVVKVEPPFEPRGRYGWRCNDYYQAYGLLESKADLAIAVDSDLLIVNDNVKTIIPLAQKFGLCMAVNGRHVVHRDAKSDSDGGPVKDPTLGYGMCHCTAFWAYWTRGPSQFASLLKHYCHEVIEGAKNRTGARGPLALWRAEWMTGTRIYTLPVQWCVTASNMGLGGEVILHVGHDRIMEHYKGLIDKWMPR